MKFYDREKEQNELRRIRQLAYEDTSRMMLVIGRRRIGKTVLMKHTFEEYGDMLYLFIARKSESELVSTLIDNLHEQTDIQELKELEEHYLKLCGIQRNSDKAIKAFHAWYKALLVFFNRIIPAENEDFNQKNKE